MEIQGRVENGVVVLDGNAILPEGTIVTVSPRFRAKAHVLEGRSRQQFPIVRSDRPGSLSISAERIVELLSIDDVST